MKQCTGCNELLPLDSFTINRATKDGLQRRCRDCIAKHKADYYDRRPEVAKGCAARSYRKRRAENPDHARSRVLQRRYGITAEDYYAMLEAQGGVCAICRRECVSGRRLAVDHDHDTGAVRGLLCGKCNRAIGYLDDNPDLMLAAADYIRANVTH